jgi:hypothetical protein
MNVFVSSAIDKTSVRTNELPMAGIRLKLQGSARKHVASAIMCLLLLQTFAFAFSPGGSLRFSHSGSGASVTAAGEICRLDIDDNGKTPAPHGRVHHCTVCCIGERDPAVDAAAILAAVVAVLAPQSDATPVWFAHRDFRPRPPGRASNWSPRAPPIFFS